MATESVRLSWQQALAWRMARHHLVERAAPEDAVRVAGDICGLHAQVMSSAELSLWARIDDLPRNAVGEALWTHRSLVKLWATRRTLHLLPAAELSAWLAALGTLSGGFSGATPADVDAITAAVGKALDGRALSREELALEVERLTGSAEYAGWLRSSWGSALKAASLRGLLCFARSEGTRVRFTSPASWLPGSAGPLPPADGWREVTRRFLHAYGPATAADLGRWWMEARSGRKVLPMLESLGDEAVEIDVEGQSAWVLAADLPDLATAGSDDVARLLPAFDPWVMGMARREPMIDPRHTGRVYRQQGWVSPVVLVNGRIAGVWRHKRAGRRLAVELEPFEPLPAWTRRQLADETRRLATFLECEPSPITFNPRIPSVTDGTE
ncbi:winged helix DNA-binding domain-containing protein [Sphaerisporangium aureirubrum]|uniref:Winged helix DNA-binding domain-containing protein n=1 Tax=Sphaerisporangium aureirubrum TaxID=1544736 RepID=A0ABW1NK22_9ACTN